MWKVFWISAGCRNQAACCLVACIVRTKALLSNLIILEILTINAGFWGLFCWCSFFFLKALSPGAVALLRITVSLLKKKSKKLRNVSERRVIWKEEVAQRRAWVRCERALPPHCFQACDFCELALLLAERVRWTGVSSQILTRHKSTAPKNSGFPSHKPWVLSRFDAKPLFVPPGFLLAFAHVFPPRAVSCFVKWR